jgi:regulator of RNase E activity RraA
LTAGIAILPGAVVIADEDGAIIIPQTFVV